MAVQVWLPGDGGIPTAIPYRKENRSDGINNYGCFDLKREPNRIGEVPEVKEYPELITALRILNSHESFFRSIGCDTDFRNPLVAACFIQIVFECVCLNTRVNHERLFERMQQRISINASSIIELSLKEVYFRAPHNKHAWSTAMRINGMGITPQQAKGNWSATILALSKFFIEESSQAKPGLDNPDCVFVTNFREPAATDHTRSEWS